MEAIIVLVITAMAVIQIAIGAQLFYRVKRLEKEGRLNEEHKSFKMSKKRG
jgi:predicted RNase H-related nuclease YkuK (DUF458 family)